MYLLVKSGAGTGVGSYLSVFWEELAIDSIAAFGRCALVAIGRWWYHSERFVDDGVEVRHLLRSYR